MYMHAPWTERTASMLAAYPAHRPDSAALNTATWIDLLEPSEAERQTFEKTFGLRVPTREQLAEIETTSRLRAESGALYMTAPLVHAADNEPWLLVPTGFVLTRTVLLTVRFAKFSA